MALVLYHALCNITKKWPSYFIKSMPVLRILNKRSHFDKNTQKIFILRIKKKENYFIT